MKNTEEDIKQKIIMPFLKTLGFENDELQFEQSFSLKIGRYAVRVDTGKQILTASPRLDILVKRQGRNLFVVEAKTDENTLTDEDRDQAISYARLVDPMAPLAVVTNGKEFKIYKVGDKSEIDKDRTKMLAYKIDQDMEIIYSEALEYFIGYSEENVQVFCNAQVDEGMKTLLGSREKKDRKFIPELYVPSKKMDKTFNAFLTSEKPVFAIIGESGSGKTCAMCGTARLKIANSPVLFYRAVNLTEGITKSMANDFNWTFSAYLDDVALFKRLDKIFKGNQIIIFIDGVDEWQQHNKVELLGDFAAKIRNRNFKLIISCKSGQWDNYLSKAGIPTSLSEELFVVGEQSKGYIIEPFDEEEFHNLIKKHRVFYDFNGLFESNVLDECKRSPFLLRVFFEVAHETKCAHLTFSVREFYSAYYRSLIERIPDDKVKTEKIILGLAKVLFAQNVATVEIGILLKELGLNINDFIIPSLFECNILEKTSSEFETRIGFYFQKLRDFIIAFGVKQWDKRSLDEFRKDWEKIDLKDVQLDACSFFYQFADIEKRKIIDEPISTNAEDYLNFYTGVLDDHFYNLKHRFSPETKGLIGFIGEFSIKRRTIGIYGFRPIQKEDEKVRLIPNEGNIIHKKDNRMCLMGANVQHYRSSCNGFRMLDIKKEVLRGEIYDQIKEIVKKGLLNETNNYYLSLEKLLGIIVLKMSNFLGIKDKWRLSKCLPISYDLIEDRFRYEKAHQYFKHKLMDDKIESGEIKTNWEGSIRSYKYTFTPGDWILINKQAEKAAFEKKEIDTTDIGLKKIEEALKETLTVVKQRKTIIDETILPDADVIGNIRWSSDFFKETTMESLISRLYGLFLDEYKILIESNFPTLKKYFPLYLKMPVHYFVTMDSKSNNDFPPGIYVIKCFNRDESRNEVTLCKKVQGVTREGEKWLFTHGDKQYEVFSAEDRGSIFSDTTKFINIDLPSEFTILRNLVYKTINDELPAVFEQLSRSYGVSE